MAPFRSFPLASADGLSALGCGSLLAFCAAADPQWPHVFALLDLQTRSVRRLTEPQAQFTCDSWPPFSPDGHTIAFTRAGWALEHDLALVDGLRLAAPRG